MPLRECLDPATKRWLLRHVDAVFGFPSIVRFSWATARKLLKAKAYGVTWHDSLDDADDEEAAGDRFKVDARTRRLDHFVSAAPNGAGGDELRSRADSQGERRHYFQQRHLRLTHSFASP